MLILNPFSSTKPLDWPFYCPQVTPDYIINYNIIYQFDNTNYCPQVTPDYTFTQAP